MIPAAPANKTNTACSQKPINLYFFARRDDSGGFNGNLRRAKAERACPARSKGRHHNRKLPARTAAQGEAALRYVSRSRRTRIE